MLRLSKRFPGAHIVPGSDNVSAGEAFGEAKHEAGEGLVAVEGPVVCAHARGETR